MSRTVVDLVNVDEIPLQRRLSELVVQVRRQAPAPAAGDALASLFEAELRLGLEAGDADRAYEAASALWRRSGDLARCHRTVARVLAALGSACADGSCSLATSARAEGAAARVLARLRTGGPVAGAPRVVLAAPAGDRHVLALESLAHLLEDAGYAADVVGDLPASELAGVARGACAVVLSVHLPTVAVTALVAAVRSAAPDVLVAVGGPAAGSCAGADLVTSDLPVLLSALSGVRCPLSEREREVLRCVADGLTNAEAAAVLGIGPATLKTHLDHIFDKTGTSGRASAVATGLRRGWIR